MRDRNAMISAEIEKCAHEILDFRAVFSQQDREKILSAYAMMRFAQGASDMKPLTFGGVMLPQYQETGEDAWGRIVVDSVVPAVRFWKKTCSVTSNAGSVFEALYALYAVACEKQGSAPLTPEFFPRTYDQLRQSIPALAA